MSSFTPINPRPAGVPAPHLTLEETGLLTPPPTPPPFNLGAALNHFGFLAPPPAPPAAIPPPPPPTPVAPAQALAPAPAQPSATSRPRWRICGKCNNTFSYKNFADHKKVHRILGDEGGLAYPCKQCMKHPERCRVAIHPEQLNTYSCVCCLGSHKACSFKSIKVERWGVWAERHPCLLEKENIPPKEGDSTSQSSVGTSDSSLSKSNSSGNTSASSVEKHLHKGRPWEL